MATRHLHLRFSSLLRPTSRLRPLGKLPQPSALLHRHPNRSYTTETQPKQSSSLPTDITDHPARTISHLDPSPSDYSRFIFQDKCRTTIYAGSGGNGCVSFLREKYIEEGPPNGGDGGSGGSIYIQAVEGMTSLHKLARRGVIRASRGKNGQGKSKGGKRGDDVLLQVPVGTVVREVSRFDPVAEEEARIRAEKAMKMEEEEAAKAAKRERHEQGEEEDGEGESENESLDDPPEEIEYTPIRHDRWVLYPGANPSDFLTTVFPRNPPRRQHIAAMEPKAPIFLDLSQHMDKPMLLAAGGAGGLGNPHWIGRSNGYRPRFASRGEGGMRLDLELELKLLADVGLVGKPNAGKSTLLRSLTNSRTRIGDWEFTTLEPNIGTVVIDDYKGRPLVESTKRTNFTIADIPGLIQGAHLDRGLGLGFLRHIERAGILAFVVDLSVEDPVRGLKNLWHELGEYERMRVEPGEQNGQHQQGNEEGEEGDWTPPSHGLPELQAQQQAADNTWHYSAAELPALDVSPIHTKPWFVVATKADLPETQERYRSLKEYLGAVEKGEAVHPGGYEGGWREKVCAVPVSAIRAEGVDRIPKLVMELLDDKK